MAASTQNQALSGVLFLYLEVQRQDVGVVELLPRARMPSKVPVVLSPSAVRQVLDRLTGVPRIVAMLLYGAGLRLQECLELRVKDSLLVDAGDSPEPGRQPILRWNDRAGE